MKIVIGGQINKEEIANQVKELTDNNCIVDVKNDLEAAMAMQQGQYDYYIGACNTGGGGALAMAIALVGADKCATISMPSTICSEEEIAAAVKDNKVAFGFTAQHANIVLPILLKYLKEN